MTQIRLGGILPFIRPGLNGEVVPKTDMRRDTSARFWNEPGFSGSCIFTTAVRSYKVHAGVFGI